MGSNQMFKMCLRFQGRVLSNITKPDAALSFVMIVKANSPAGPSSIIFVTQRRHVSPHKFTKKGKYRDGPVVMPAFGCTALVAVF